MAMALVTNAGVAAATSASLGLPRLPAPSRGSPHSSRASAWGSSHRHRLGLWSSPASERRGDGQGRSETATGAILDLHSFAFLADLIDETKLPVRITLDPARVFIEEKSASQLSEEAIKTFYMGFALVFSWGCCVFGSMNDKFYDGEEYRKAGGNGTGHWLYDQRELASMAAREEMWSEDLMKEIEEKAQEVRKAEEEKEKELV